MSNSEIRNIVLNDISKTYILTRKQVKNINLRIKIDGSLCVSAPKNLEISVIDEFLISKSLSILKHLNEFENLITDTTPVKQYVSGESFYLLGKNIRLKVTETVEESVYADGVYLYLNIKDKADFKRKEFLVQKFYDVQRDIYYKEIVDDTFSLFEKYGISYPVVKVRTMKSRWGSCTPKKQQITLNKLLIETPKKCLEYVVMHEFTHFIYPNHSKDFYNFLFMMMPDWKERKDILEDFIFKGKK